MEAGVEGQEEEIGLMAEEQVEHQVDKIQVNQHSSNNQRRKAKRMQLWR